MPYGVSITMTAATPLVHVKTKPQDIPGEGPITVDGKNYNPDFVSLAYADGRASDPNVAQVKPPLADVHLPQRPDKWDMHTPSEVSREAAKWETVGAPGGAALQIQFELRTSYGAPVARLSHSCDVEAQVNARVSPGPKAPPRSSGSKNP